MKELTVRANDAGQRLDRFVSKAVPLLPESLLQKYIRLKRIKLNGSPKAYYFQQAKNGVFARMAIMTTILGLTDKVK